MLALLAVLKTQAAYVPLDPVYPPERVRYVLEDTNASLLLSTAQLAQPFNELVALVDVDVWLNQALPTQESFEVLPYPEPSQLAYVIYTSGSTGKPKGVMIEHGSLSNLLYWHK